MGGHLREGQEKRGKWVCETWGEGNRNVGSTKKDSKSKEKKKKVKK